MSKVYVTQHPGRRKIDLSQAEEFGELNFLMDNGKEHVLNPARTAWTLKNGLKEFSGDDYLLALGDPTLIMQAAIIAARNTNGTVKCLWWDRETSRYMVTELRDR